MKLTLEHIHDGGDAKASLLACIGEFAAAIRCAAALHNFEPITFAAPVMAEIINAHPLSYDEMDCIDHRQEAREILEDANFSLLELARGEPNPPEEPTR